jgi:transmembrane protein DUF3566
MSVTIKHIGVGSAFKVGFVLSLIVSAVCGLIGAGFDALFTGVLSSAFRSYGTTNLDFGAVGLPILCIGYLIGVVVAGIAGGIGAAILALLYNLVSDRIGGLQVELSRDIS